MGFWHLKLLGVSTFQKGQLGGMQNYRRLGNFDRKAGSGSWKISTPEQDARLVAKVERNPFHTTAIFEGNC